MKDKKIIVNYIGGICYVKEEKVNGGSEVYKVYLSAILDL